MQAADDVSFEIKEGEYFTLLGPSGCGKTTTLQCIAGLETPDEGEIVMAGELVFSSKSKVAVPAHRRDIGMVFQSYAIWPHMTVFDNVAFPLTHGRRRVSKGQVAERVMNALSLVQLQELANRPAPFLSGGQQQRVALARAIVGELKLLLLDEPLSNLDAKLRDEMRLEIRSLVSRLQITTLYVTHDQTEALFLSHRIALMKSGKIIQEGTPRQIFLTPRDQFVADFLGKSNFLKGQVVERTRASQIANVDTAVGRMRCVVTEDIDGGEAVVLAVRPSGIQVNRTAPSEDENTFRGTIHSLNFIGDFMECQVQAGNELVKVMLDPYQEFRLGEEVYLHIPSERLATITEL